MRTYSMRERLLLAVFGIICLAGGVAMAVIIVSFSDARRDPLAWAAALGGFCLATVAAKIAFTGTAWRYFERKVGFSPPAVEKDDV